MCLAYRQAIAATSWDSTSLSDKLGLRGFGRSSLVLYLEGMTNDTTYLHRALSLTQPATHKLHYSHKTASLPQAGMQCTKLAFTTCTTHDACPKAAACQSFALMHAQISHFLPSIDVVTGEVMAIFSPPPPFMLRKSSSIPTGDVMAIFSPSFPP